MEVVISISIFFIIAFSVLNLKISSAQLRKRKVAFENFKNSIETLRNVILTEYSYEDIEAMNEETYYIKNDELKVDSIFNKGIGVLSIEKPLDTPFIKVNFKNDQEGIFVQCSYKYDKAIDPINYNFLKGKLNEKRDDSN
ncbi:hypothetical protein ACOAKC_06255 [Hathewaya histolytica]|uniref:hypothetical protein n=1 Tax=Hathewaya histolytica TaxID=1498 RepID=UPI003B67DBCC